MKMYQHRIQAGRGDGEAHHAAEDHGAAQHAQFVCHGHYVLHEPAIQVGRGLDPRDYYFAICQGLVSVYRAGRLVIRKVLKIRIWDVPPACLGSR